MAIKNTVMVPASSAQEFGLLVSYPTGITKILHINKDFEKVSREVKELVDVRLNPAASGRHFFVSEKTENKPKEEVSIVEISPNRRDEESKWEALTFSDVYIDFHQTFRFHPGAVCRKVGIAQRPSLVTFDSFVKFMELAYPCDYQKWKLVEPDLAWVRQSFAVPTLG